VLTIFIDWWPYFEQTKCQFVMIPSFNLWWFMMRHRTWRHYVMISLSNKLSQNVNLRWFLLLICDGLWCGIGPEDIMWQFIFSQSSICGVDDAIIIKMLPSLVHSGVHWWCMTKFYISSPKLKLMPWCSHFLLTDGHILNKPLQNEIVVEMKSICDDFFF
jgi:hypothetical protein